MDGSISGSLSAVFNEYHLILCAAVWGLIRRCSQESLSHLSLCTLRSETNTVLHKSTNLRHCPSVSALTVEAHFSPSRWPEMEEIQVQFLRHFEQSQKNHYCSREEPLRGQLAAEGWRAFKENSLHFKTMIFWGRSGVQRTSWKEGTLPLTAGKQIYWKKPSLLSLLGSKMWILKYAVPKQRYFKCWHCRRKTQQNSVGPQYKVHSLFKFTFSLHAFRVNNHPN